MWQFTSNSLIFPCESSKHRMSNFTRRQFLKQVFVVTSVGTVVLGCGDHSGDESRVDTTRDSGAELPRSDQGNFSCMDGGGLSEEEVALRMTFQYTDQSPEQEKNCRNCVLFVEAESGNQCGSCLSIKGPIHPKGYCTIWAARPVVSTNT